MSISENIKENMDDKNPFNLESIRHNWHHIHNPKDWKWWGWLIFSVFILLFILLCLSFIYIGFKRVSIYKGKIIIFILSIFLLVFFIYFIIYFTNQTWFKIDNTPLRFLNKLIKSFRIIVILMMFGLIFSFILGHKGSKLWNTLYYLIDCLVVFIVIFLILFLYNIIILYIIE